MAKKKKKTNSYQTKQVAMFVVVALLFGWVVGFLVGTEVESDDIASHNEVAIVHAHDPFELDPNDPNLPSVMLLASPDSKQGWNLTLVTENFVFDPPTVGLEEVAGRGHAHLWINGEKVDRIYSNYHYVGKLDQGDHDIAVTLNTNKHSDFTVNGQVIMDEITITETRSSDDYDSHEHNEDGEVAVRNHSHPVQP